MLTLMRIKHLALTGWLFPIWMLWDRRERRREAERHRQWYAV